MEETETAAAVGGKGGVKHVGGGEGEGERYWEGGGG